MLAQRYPTAYDGIAAGAPAIYWTELFASMQWPEVFMNSIQAYPHHCELDALTALAVKECDGLDGVTDGVIADVDACLRKFDPLKQVGKPLNCSTPNAPSTISKGAAQLIKASWEGSFKASGERLWYGLSPGADLTGQGPYAPPGGSLGLATTICTGDGCVPFTFPLSDFWVRYFVAKDPTFNTGNVTRAEFERLYRDARREYHSTVGTDDPDLSDFRAAGGKLVTYHGLVSFPSSLSSVQVETDTHPVGLCHCPQGNAALPQGGAVPDAGLKQVLPTLRSPRHGALLRRTDREPDPSFRPAAGVGGERDSSWIFPV